MLKVNYSKLRFHVDGGALWFPQGQDFTSCRHHSFIFHVTDPKQTHCPPVKITGPALQIFQHCWELAGNKTLQTSYWVWFTLVPERGFFHTIQAIREVYLVAFGSSRETSGVVQLPDFEAQHSFKKGKRAGFPVFSSLFWNTNFTLLYLKIYKGRTRKRKCRDYQQRSISTLHHFNKHIQKQLLSLHVLLCP